MLSTRPLEEAITASIKLVTKRVLEDTGQFAEDLQKQYENQTVAESSADQEELRKVNARIAELDRLIQNLYQKNLDGTIPDRQFERMMNQFNEEQITCESRKQELESKTVSLSARKTDLPLTAKYRCGDAYLPEVSFINRNIHLWIIRKIYLMKVMNCIHGEMEIPLLQTIKKQSSIILN